ncbi:MAG TPA: hypothetical protein VHT91_50500 [Kofleriaceae bacterium]|nr:hypothetical protein [Kofleriaceae bacterium]
MAVASDRAVLRTPIPPKDFSPETWRPTWETFRPSSDDKDDAQRRGGQVRVSVWDSTLTTTTQARAFRDKDTLVLRGGVQHVLEASAQAVVCDPLTPPNDARPGADGHAGIEGLDRANGEQKQSWKNRLDCVAATFALELAA